MASRRGPKPPKCDAPEQVRALKLELARLGREERAVRKRWYEARRQHSDAAALDSSRDARLAVGECTIALWQAEQTRLTAAERWRNALGERGALPVDERWNLADLEAWVVWHAGVL